RRALHAFAGLAVALADAAGFLAAEAEARDLDLGKGNGDDVLALASDQLALGQVLPEFLLDHAADDLAEPLHVAIDLAQHRRHRASRPMKARVREFPRRDKIGGRRAACYSARQPRGTARFPQRSEDAFSTMKYCDTCRSAYPNDFSTCPRDQAPLRATADLVPGMVVRGKYEVLEKIGAGGMAAVYKVRHLAFGEIRALKVVA